MSSADNRAVGEAPIGAIVAFAGPPDRVSDDWLICDGRSLDRTDPRYHALFEEIGSTWGGDGANSFCIPDLRGMFLRGVDRGADGTYSGRDPDRDQRRPANPELAVPGNQGNAVGSIETDALGRHDHPAETQLDPIAHRHSYREPSGPGGFGTAQTDHRGLRDVETSPVTIMASTEVKPAGGSETRPVNAGVYWIIRVR